MKILLVEDEPASLKLAHVVLTSDGHEVIDAQAADKAIEEIRLSEPDVILLDLELPNVDGLTLARSLKSAEATKRIVIIAVTAYPDRFPRDEALESGCDAYIVKPINTRILTSQVTDIVERLK